MPRPKKQKVGKMDNNKISAYFGVKATSDGEVFPLLNVEENTSDTIISNASSAQTVKAPDGSLYVVEEIEELIEHICAKCEQTFDNLEVLKAHLPACRSKGLTEFIATKQEPGVDHFVMNIPHVVNSSLHPPAEPETRVTIAMDHKNIDEEDDDDGFEDPTEEELNLWNSHNDENLCYCCG